MKNKKKIIKHDEDKLNKLLNKAMIKMFDNYFKNGTGNTGKAKGLINTKSKKGKKSKKKTTKFGKVCQELFEKKQKEKIDGGSLEIVSNDDMLPDMYRINVATKWHESNGNITPNNEKYTYVNIVYYLFNGLEIRKMNVLSPAIVYIDGDYAVLKHADEVKIKPQFSPDEIGFFTTDIFNLSVLYMQTKVLNEDKGEQND